MEFKITNKKGAIHPSPKGNGFLASIDKILKIRELKNNGLSYQKIADIFGIGLSTCARIVNREDWNHVR